MLVAATKINQSSIVPAFDQGPVFYRPLLLF